MDRSANELPVADAAAVGLVVAPWFRVIPRSALIVPAGGAWLADARDAERRGGRALTIAAAGVDRDAEAATVALAGRAADAPPALGAAGQPLRAVGVSATLTSREAGVPTLSGARRTAAEAATDPEAEAMTEPLAAPGAGLVRLALPGAGLPGRGTAAPVNAVSGSGPEQALVEATATGERIGAQVAAHTIAHSLAGSAAAAAKTEGDILLTDGVAAALPARATPVTEWLTTNAAAITAAQTRTASADADVPLGSTGPRLGPSRANADGGENGTGEEACRRTHEVAAC
jgi:hypothetical protein